MSEHTWEVEEIDGGPVGVGDFWICQSCQASGGPKLWSERPPPVFAPFYADGCGMRLTMDCDESLQLVTEHFRVHVRGAVAEGFKRELAHALGCSLPTVQRWVDGVNAPQPRMFKHAIDACRKLLPTSCRIA